MAKEKKEKLLKENKDRFKDYFEGFKISDDLFPSGVVSPHWHSFYELELLLGSGHTTINGTQYFFDKATFHLMTPLDIHSIVFNEDSFKRYDINFSLDNIESSLIRDYLLDMRGGFIQVTDNNVDYYVNLFKRFSELYPSKSKKSDHLLTKILELLIMEFVNFNLSQNNSKNKNIPYKANIASALFYIQNHYREDIKLRDVANHIYVSEKYFSNLFKKEMGCSFSEYIIRLRIENACHILAHTNDTISVIAAESGFNSQNHFYKMFKKYTNMSPAEYKKKFKNNMLS